MWVEKHGPHWRIRDQRAGRKITVQGGYLTKTAAKTAMVGLLTDLQRGEALIHRGGAQTVEQFLDMWEPSYLASLGKPSSRQSEGGRLRTHIRGRLGDHTLDELDSLLIQKWIAVLLVGERDPDRPDRWLRRPLSPKSVRNCHALLSKMCGAAVRLRLIRANPCAGTTLPPRQHKEMRFLTDPEIARLLAHTPDHWRPLVALLVATGLRWGEAIGLRRKNVDVLATTPRLVVLEHLHELAGSGELIWTAPKSERSRRTVTFPKRVAMLLVPLVSGKDRDEVVFTAPNGGLVRTRNFRRGWVKWTRAAGLPGLRIHDLRHTHAAILISDGRSLAAIQRRLGHSSISVTVDLYGHLREEVDEGIILAIDTALADAIALEVVEELAAA